MCIRLYFIHSKYVTGTLFPAWRGRRLLAILDCIIFFATTWRDNIHLLYFPLHDLHPHHLALFFNSHIVHHFLFFFLFLPHRQASFHLSFHCPSIFLLPYCPAFFISLTVLHREWIPSMAGHDGRPIEGEKDDGTKRHHHEPHHTHYHTRPHPAPPPPSSTFTHLQPSLCRLDVLRLWLDLS